MSERNELPGALDWLLRADGEGPARRIDAAAAQRLIDGALAAAGAAEPANVRPLRGKRVFWLLAAAIVFTGSAAAMYAAQRAGDAPAHAALPSPARPARVTPQEPAAAEPEQPAEIAATTTTRAATADAADSARASGQRAQDLLRRANRLRGEGQYQAAERTYLRVVAQTPNGAPAYTARVAAASLRLERLSDPRGALQLYKQALRSDPNGPLGPEIHEGMALAYRKLGKRDDERRALQALLAEQPSGPAAERARARLRELATR